MSLLYRELMRKIENGEINQTQLAVIFVLFKCKPRGIMRVKRIEVRHLKQLGAVSVA